MQDLDYKWFEENCKELYKQYKDSYLAIKDEKVLGSYPTYAEAVHQTEQKYDIGTFIVQKCTENVDAYAVYIASAHFMPEEVEA